MELNITTEGFQNPWKDPLFKVLYEYAVHVELEPQVYGIQDMDTLFSFLQSRMEEFMKANPTYRKPIGLELCYCRPSCCAPTIRVSYTDQKFIIKSKPLNHEKNPSKTHSHSTDGTISNGYPCDGANSKSAQNARIGGVSHVRKEMVQGGNSQAEGSPQRHSEVQ